MKLARVAFWVIAFGFATSALAGPVSTETGPNLVTNGGFETANFTGWTQFGDMNFTGVSSTGYVHSGSYGAHFGPTSPGGIFQNIPTIAGTSYNIHFWFQNLLGPGELKVSWGGAEVYHLVNAAGFNFTEIVIDPPATGPTTELRFEFVNPSDFWGLDDVSVFATAAAVPAPTSMALLALALAGLGWSRRLR